MIHAAICLVFLASTLVVIAFLRVGCRSEVGRGQTTLGALRFGFDQVGIVRHLSFSRVWLLFIGSCGDIDEASGLFSRWHAGWRLHVVLLLGLDGVAPRHRWLGGASLLAKSQASEHLDSIGHAVSP